jgi:hypothetical protein
MTKNIQPLIKIDYLSSLLQEEDFIKFKEITSELKDTWTKKQIFRTKTEMRISVLSDYKHPNNASKYWQCVREQNAHFECLISLSFEYRKNDIEIKKVQKKLENEKDELELELIKIELDEKLYAKASMELTAKDRMREINEWSKLKKEFNDGNFDDVNVDTHQSEAYKYILENRAKTLTPGSSQPEVFNVLTQLDTLNRLHKEGILPLPNKEAITNISKPNKENISIGKPNNEI